MGRQPPRVFNSNYLFLRATDRYGIPSRVQCDQRGENVQVALYMNRQRSSDRRSVLVGKSVHNQRIERLWSDMHQCATMLYYRLFHHMENIGILDPLNERHLFALHYIFLPRINNALDVFTEGWNRHSLRTANNFSPLQLFTEGRNRLRNSGYVGEYYGMDTG